jgi:hypothetical protein
MADDRKAEKRNFGGANDAYRSSHTITPCTGDDPLT